MADAVVQVDAHRVSRCRIVRGVQPAAAGQHVGVGAAGQRVVALAAAQRVDPGAAQQPVVAAAAFQHIVAALARQHVRACAAQDHVARSGTGDRIVKGRTDDALDRDQAVPLGIATGADAAIHRDLHARARFGVAGRVIARAAVQRIGAAQPRQLVVARAAGQQLVRARSAQLVVEGGGGHLLDRHQGIAARQAAGAGAGRQVDADRRGRCGVIDRVEPGAAVDPVGAQ